MNKRPNIIFIVMDTAGTKHMSIYGYHRRTTPNLERIGEECTLYTRCFAPSCWTLPSHASMFTGLYPKQHGVHGWNLMDRQCTHLANLLKQGGYKTYGFSSNPIVSPATGIGRHFDLFLDYGKSEQWFVNEGTDNPQRQEFLYQLSLKRMSADKVIYFLRYVLANRDWAVLRSYLKRYLRKTTSELDPVNYSAPFSSKSLQEGLKIIKDHCRSSDGCPYFMFFNLMEPHHYYNPPTQARIFSSPQDKQLIPLNLFYDSKNLNKYGHLMSDWINLYDDEIVYMDALLGNFYDCLNQNGMLNNTVVILTSDHGEHFGEKGHYEHRFSLYNELIWVPLLVKFPVSLASPGVTDRLTSLNDLFSTILDLADSPWPRPFTSCSLLATEMPSTVASMILSPLFWESRMTADYGHDHWLQGLRKHHFALLLSEGWKLIEGEDGQLEIYNLNQDPWEECDLFTTMPTELRADFQGLFQLHRDQILSKTIP